MEHSYCLSGHEVWWGELDGERTPFVRCTHGYRLSSDEAEAAQVPCAHAVRYCYTLHARICACDQFTPPRCERPVSRGPRSREEVRDAPEAD